MKHYSINKTKFLNQSEMDYLRNRTQSNVLKEVHSLFVILGVETGGRCSEILNIKKSDLDSENKSILIHGLKNSNDREIPLKDETWDLVYSYAGGLDRENLFTFSSRHVRRFFKSFIPKDSIKTFHSLRHSFAINIFKKTKDIRFVQVCLGHRDIKNTLVYSAYVYETEEMREKLL